MDAASVQPYCQTDDDEVNQETNIIAFDGSWLIQSNGFWYPETVSQGLFSFQRNFEAMEGDIMVASMPKCGTTWLKALVFSIVNRHLYPADHSPLLTSNPHQLVPFEFLLHPEMNHTNSNSNTNTNMNMRPRIFGTHLPFQALPRSILDSSNCKIVYVCRNPLDQFISLWHFYQNLSDGGYSALPLETAFEIFFEGKQPFGPFWNHMLGYWDSSKKGISEKVLFLKYEDLKIDTAPNVKKMAEFLGFPFTKEEEENGKIEEITQLCSIQSLKSMEVNKTGILYDKVPIKKCSFFRKGEVGDWVNHLSPSMADRVEKLMAEKFANSGLTFEPNLTK